MSVMDLKINGSGNYGGGQYNAIKVNGAAVLDGDTECREIKINGSCQVKGKLSAEEMKVNGAATLKQGAEIGELKINGNCQIEEDAQIETFKLSGSAKLQGSLKGKTVKITGKLSVSGTVETESFFSSGSFQINGLLAGDVIDINPRASKSFAREIGGEKITIKRRNELGMFLPFASRGKVEAEVIEGDEIYLEHTHAQVVRGRNVEIGPGCNIQRVECSGVYKQSPEGYVKHRENAL